VGKPYAVRRRVCLTSREIIYNDVKEFSHAGMMCTKQYKLNVILSRKKLYKFILYLKSIAVIFLLADLQEHLGQSAKPVVHCWGMAPRALN